MYNIRREKGFTLVEVMVVAFVLAILASIMVMAYSQVREAAETHLCVANQRTIYEAAVMYTLNEPGSLKKVGTA